MRILLADNQPKVRFALRLLLGQEEGISVVGEAAAAEGLFTQIETTCPDLVLLDWDLPGVPMVDLLSALNNTYPALSVIALSWRLELERLVLDAGADAFISKADPPEQLLAAICSLDRVEATPFAGEGEVDHVQRTRSTHSEANQPYWLCSSCRNWRGSKCERQNR